MKVNNPITEETEETGAYLSSWALVANSHEYCYTVLTYYVLLLTLLIVMLNSHEYIQAFIKL